MFVPYRCLASACLALVALIAALPRFADAQSTPPPQITADRWQDDLAGWVSVGLGPAKAGSQASGLLAGVARGNVSAGPLLLTYRASDVGPFLGSGRGVREGGVLAGVRSRGHRVFATAAVGYSRARGYYQGGMDSGGYRVQDASVGALAYELSLHANAYVPGLAVSMFGDVGPGKSSYSAFTISVELGWFGGD